MIDQISFPPYSQAPNCNYLQGWELYNSSGVLIWAQEGVFNQAINGQGTALGIAGNLSIIDVCNIPMGQTYIYECYIKDSCNGNTKTYLLQNGSFQNSECDPITATPEYCCPRTNELLEQITGAITDDCNLNKAIRVVMDCPSSSLDVEKTILCDVGGDKILVEVSYIDGVRQPVVYFNLNTNSNYTGNPATDLVVCPDIELESDGLPYCLTATNETIIGYSVKQNGEPTGVVYWTNIDGVAIPAPATGTYTFGACTISQIRTFLGDDLLSVDDVTQVTLTPPVGANLAEIQSQGIDLRYSFNGFINGGKVISNFTRLELESLSEIVNVSFLSFTGTGNVHIDYFFEPNLINN